jgi:hypothetical protein
MRCNPQPTLRPNTKRCLDNLPEKLQSSMLGQKLEAISDLGFCARDLSYGDSRNSSELPRRSNCLSGSGEIDAGQLRHPAKP